MSDKKFTIDVSKEGIEIEIARRKNERDIFTPIGKKGIIQLNAKLDYLPRRTKQAITGILLYDLGQILVGGGWEDNNFRADANNVFDSENYVSTDDLQFTDLTAKANYFINLLNGFRAEATAMDLTGAAIEKYAKDKLTALFLQITPVEADYFLFRIRTDSFSFESLTSTNPRWTGGKVVISENETINYVKVDSEPLSSQFYINPNPAITSRSKVTLLGSFSADEINLTPSKSAIYFVCPAFCKFTLFSSAHVKYPHDKTDVFYGNEYDYDYEQNLYCDYRTFPRNELTEFIILWRSLSFFASQLYPNSNNAAIYRLFYYVSQWIVSLPEKLNQGKLTGTYSETQPNGDILHTEKTAYQENPFPFPKPSIFPVPPEVLTFNDAGVPKFHKAIVGSVTATGDLLAIIYQDNQFYFVWER